METDERSDDTWPRRGEIARREDAARRLARFFRAAAVARKEAYHGAGQQWPTGASAAAITTKRPSSAAGPGSNLARREDRAAISASVARL